ncbi:Hypothetical protein Nlim_1171 [Candidatus Nitrosarchaeum limnium SFB1]|uniref:Uncharacterized protein n=1 Tax=Candidatus Nitrosarchaeum limnium SFB1 TaxID=886738 RepID=F3KL39_9ARCH|nr:Hypothetical protein Nlim_1171 [Candidatus Nitrosarchaeum limnium SFB1]
MAGLNNVDRFLSIKVTPYFGQLKRGIKQGIIELRHDSSSCGIRQGTLSTKKMWFRMYKILSSQ